MTNRTDDELGRLLKETFADKENLVLDSQFARAETADQLPVATRPRRAPILLAAAAVLVILAGVLYAANPRGGSEPGPAGATGSGTQTNQTTQVIPNESLIWAATIKGILDREQNPTKDPVLYVLNAPYENAGDTTKQTRGVPFTEAERIGIENALTGVAPIEWVRQRDDGSGDCPANPRGPFIMVGPIEQRAGHVEVGVNIWRDCLNARWVTFTLAQQGSTWKVTGTTGPEAIS
ncbi:hypothetical protein EV643_12175 [Kribbella sp. VKM Ac-2527]|uniref:Uncharacterized protein n=1 Tax=Kribbella caucasensis TaxID=2512215 RepID=A0A4R6JI56_9ACTN|nr:hypothetical protein [Kribbella sp. VKM Ac-2527]TDO35803.1 hypothetical protein EV643_12175 [Kribbella sp. VKM Ac-2527]